MDKLKLDEKKTAQILESFLKEKLERSGLSGYVIGLSGGIDSSLSAAAAVSAVGPDKVLGILMPYRMSSEAAKSDAQLVAQHLKIESELIDISPMIDTYFKDIEKVDKVRAGNKMARERMSILFDKAFKLGRLVLGTSNRTEICLGYGTWYGDVACSVNPNAELYKTQVRRMAAYYELPDKIVNKVPTADLWPGQTDEEELGLEYAEVDKLLYMMIEEAITDRMKLNNSGFDNALIDRAVYLLNRFYFKRHLPEIAELGLKPIPDKINIA